MSNPCFPNPEESDALTRRITPEESAAAQRSIDAANEPAQESEPLAKITELITVQKSACDCVNDSYFRGLVNGLILAKSVIDGNDPQYVEKPAPPAVTNTRAVEILRELVEASNQAATLGASDDPENDDHLLRVNARVDAAWDAADAWYTASPESEPKAADAMETDHG